MAAAREPWEQAPMTDRNAVRWANWVLDGAADPRVNFSGANMGLLATKLRDFATKDRAMVDYTKGTQAS